MILEAIKYLFDRGIDYEEARTDRVKEIKGETAYFPKGGYPRRLKEALDEQRPEQTAIVSASLSGLIDLVSTLPVKDGALVVQPRAVFYEAGWYPRGSRRIIAYCEVAGEPYPLGRWLAADEASALLRARAVTNGDLLSLLAKLSHVSVAQTRSVSQLAESSSITIAFRGDEAEGKVEIPAVVVLKMLRTFPEVDQPLGSYVVRVRLADQVEIQLIDAGGGAWEMVAAEAIREYLKANCDVPVW